MRNLLICLACLLFVAAAPPDSPGSETERRVDALASLYEDLGMFNGVVLLAHGGKVVLEKGYGMASYELIVPNKPEMRFRIASLSKAITKLAIGKLWETGKLTPDTKLDRFVPEYPHAKGITLRQLLDHRAGVPHLNKLPWYETESRHHQELDELVDRIGELPLDFEPGTENSYSNGGYALLALVIERSSGVTYAEYLRRAILDPLGMHSTGHDAHGFLLPNRATGYLPGPKAGVRIPAQYVEPSIKVGGGSLYSTVRDLLRFDRALLGDNILRRATWESLFDSSDDEVWMTGRAPGYYAVYRRLLEKDWTLIVLSNNYAVHPMDDYLPALIGEESFEMPDYRADLELPAGGWAEYLGRYQWPEPYGTEIEIMVGADRRPTYVEVHRDQRVGLFPQSERSFFHPLYNTVCTFEKNDSDETTHLECTAPWSAEPIRLERLSESGPRTGR